MGMLIFKCHMTPEYAQDEFPLVQAFALAAYDQENNPWCAVKRTTDGYIAQERWKDK